MEIDFIKKDPDKGYFGRNLWLPKKHINVRSVKSGLEYPVIDANGITYLQLWSDDTDHLIVPREYVPLKDYKLLKFPVVNVNTAKFKRVFFRSRVVLDKKKPHEQTQRKAFGVMSRVDSGLLNLACVAGDTVISFNRGGKGFSMPIEKAYKQIESGRWKSRIPTRVRSKMEDRIGLNEMETIVYRGKRQTYVLTLCDGKKLRLTADHEVLTKKGWIQLQHLAVGDSVITDGDRVKSIRKPKSVYKRLSWYPNHPYVRKQVRKTGKIDYQIEEHRAVAEAALNNIDLAEYRERCWSGNTKGLKFIDPSKYHVHHLDENVCNNDKSNLEVLEKEKHLGKHRPGARAFGYGETTPIKIKSIVKGKVEDVYDIVCKDPYRNFVANGIVIHNCGKGKTIIALHHIAYKKVPALVVVNNTTLISQWRERVEEFLDVEGGVGVVQGAPNTWDWKGRGVVLAMINTLALRHEEMPIGFSSYFGGIYFDECHHLSAPLFIKTAPMFYGNRYGLTATVEREDGLEGVYQYHIGRVFHRDLMPELKPRIYFQAHPVMINENDVAVKKEICDKSRQINIPKYRGYLGRLVENNEFIAHKIREPLKTGRKVLVLSHSKDQLKLLHEMFPESGLCTGDEEPDARMSVLKTKQIIFGTLQLVKEALDEQTLDTIFFLTAFGSSTVSGGGKNTLQQGMGRILREWSGKKTPVVVIVDYVNIPRFHKMCRRLKALLHSWPRDQGGPYEYTLLKPFAEK